MQPEIVLQKEPNLNYPASLCSYPTRSSWCYASSNRLARMIKISTGVS